jgi:hypothetical protein
MTMMVNNVDAIREIDAFCNSKGERHIAQGLIRIMEAEMKQQRENANKAGKETVVVINMNE